MRDCDFPTNLPGLVVKNNLEIEFGISGVLILLN